MKIIQILKTEGNKKAALLLNKEVLIPDGALLTIYRRALLMVIEFQESGTEFSVDMNYQRTLKIGAWKKKQALVVADLQERLRKMDEGEF